MVILPATYTGSPRNMHEYAQDGLTYVKKFGRPDLFITFTCNPNWEEISELLTSNQTNMDRHDVIARVFKQKLRRLIDLIVKYKLFGNIRCWMYSIEWQKRGLPHAHILLWLYDKISPNNIDDIISAEIPNEHHDPILYEIIRKHMIHGPCGQMNSSAPCMKDNVCTKRFPKLLVNETQSGLDGYPLYRRRSQKEGGYTTTIKCNKIDVSIDNSWIVPYSPILCKIFKAHINVEYCHSVKSIKYICKYICKGTIF